MSVPGAPAPIGVVAHFTLLERLEPHGPGELYRARDTRLGRTVSVRVLPPDFLPDPEARTALVRKAETLAQFSHPNVIALFAAGEQDGRLHVVFEHVKGQSLRAELAGRMMNVRRSVELAVQMADAVAAAHAAGMIHGGLSPDSIVITSRGHAKIPVFELAVRGGFEEGSEGTRLRDYHAPEEARGDVADERSDIYSIGAVLYEMLTSRRPHPRGASAPSASNPNAPRALDDVVLKALAPNPASRWQSAAAFAAELRTVAAGFDPRPAAREEPKTTPAPAAGAGRAIGLAVLILLGLGLVAWLAF